MPGALGMNSVAMFYDVTNMEANVNKKCNDWLDMSEYRYVYLVYLGKNEQEGEK